MLTHPAGFRQRRALNWLLAGAMYAFFYMARYNFAAVSALLAELFGWSNTRLGVISAVGTTVYGVSVFFNGPLADKIGGRRAILVGAAGAAGFNLLFGLMHLSLAQPAVWAGEGAARHVVLAAQIRMGMTGSTVIAAFATLWACNHYFQSFGALSIVKINAAWFHVRERGFFAGIFGILIRAGLILAFYGSPLILSVLPWQWVFWVPALMLGGLFAANFVLLRNTPRDAGFGEYETGDETAAEKAEPASLGFVLAKVFASPTVWTIAGASLMIGFVRRSVIDDWWPKYFANVFGADPKHLAAFPPYLVAAWGIALAGIVGGIVFGLLSDRVFGGRRAPVVVIAFGAQALLLAAFGLAERAGAGAMTAACALLSISFFVNGAHGMVGGAASMDFGGRKAAATAAGLIDGVQYLIAGPLVGVGMGRLLDTYGWSVWQLAPLPFALAGALLMSRLWNALPAARLAAGEHASKPAAATQ
ncbi:MAG TPA: MFS transporter [Polyangia bacterium]|nr:MFS transporter [Polyangia bacterium]